VAVYRGGMEPIAETKSPLPAPLGTVLVASPSNGLSLKRVAIDTYHENVAYLHRDCAVVRAEGFQALSKVEVHANVSSILATLNVVDDASIVGCHELGVSEDAFAQLKVPDGHAARVSQAEPPASMPALFRKINGERLGREDFAAIVRDIAQYRYSKIELTAFVVACNRSELDREEVYFLTEAMVASGRRLDWGVPLVVDKHCIGGIPGNRPSMLVVPIVAAHGLVFPKTSSRAITRRPAPPTPWRCRPRWSCRSSSSPTSCAGTALFWPGAAPPTCRQPTMC
jgi:thymidine phosphorylase